MSDGLCSSLNPHDPSLAAGGEPAAPALGHGDRLATALNTGYVAEQVGLFSIVMGVALLPTGIGVWC